MKTLTESLNLAFGARPGAYVMTNVNLGVAAYDTLCLICAELDFDVKDVEEEDFNSAVEVLEKFVDSATPETGYTVSVWFD